MVAKIYSSRSGSWAINFALDTDAWRIAKEKNKQQLFLLYSSGTNVRYSVWGVPTRRSYCGIQQNCKLQNLTNLDLCRYVDTPLELYELLWEQYKSLAASRNCGITARPRWHKTQSANTNHGQWKSISIQMIQFQRLSLKKSLGITSSRRKVSANTFHTVRSMLQTQLK
jgi:hypothetical protein